MQFTLYSVLIARSSSCQDNILKISSSLLPKPFFLRIYIICTSSLIGNFPLRHIIQNLPPLMEESRTTLIHFIWHSPFPGKILILLLWWIHGRLSVQTSEKYDWDCTWSRVWSADFLPWWLLWFLSSSKEAIDPSGDVVFLKYLLTILCNIDP